MRKFKQSALVATLAFILAPAAMAEDSERETPPEELEFAESKGGIPEETKAFIAYLEDLDARYPDSSRVDIDTFMATEGEYAATLFCDAMGMKGGCVVEQKDGVETLVPLAEARTSGVARGRWYEWLYKRLFNVGVIPNENRCPAGTEWVQIHMDDEDRKNANSRWGWLGATVSTNNTTWRLCKLDTITSLLYRPLPRAGTEHTYAVLNMGLFCPSGARRVVRGQENEIWRNQNSSSGTTFPNFRVYNYWTTFYCVFDGGARSLLGHMQGFPNLGFGYGVFAPTSFSTTYAIQRGYVFQDDEDTVNLNFWIGSPNGTMGDTRNTWRGLAKVRN